MTEKKITTKIRVYSYNELTEEQKKLVDLAREATKNSYSPYSQFKVGAALELDNGEVFIGANQENAAFQGCRHHFLYPRHVCRGADGPMWRVSPGFPGV